MTGSTAEADFCAWAVVRPCVVAHVAFDMLQAAVSQTCSGDRFLLNMNFLHALLDSHKTNKDRPYMNICIA